MPALLDGHLRKRDLEPRLAVREHQHIVGGIDDSGQRCAAFPAIEPIAFKAAGVDARHMASAKLQSRIATGACAELRAR